MTKNFGLKAPSPEVVRSPSSRWDAVMAVAVLLVTVGSGIAFGMLFFR